MTVQDQKVSPEETTAPRKSGQRELDPPTPEGHHRTASMPSEDFGNFLRLKKPTSQKYQMPHQSRGIRLSERSFTYPLVTKPNLAPQDQPGTRRIRPQLSKQLMKTCCLMEKPRQFSPRHAKSRVRHLRENYQHPLTRPALQSEAISTATTPKDFR